MKPLELTQYRVAQDIGVASLRISQIVHGKRAITADTALGLARYFGTTPGIWLRLQVRTTWRSLRRRWARRFAARSKNSAVLLRHRSPCRWLHSHTNGRLQFRPQGGV